MARCRVRRRLVGFGGEVGAWVSDSEGSGSDGLFGGEEIGEEGGDVDSMRTSLCIVPKSAC